MAPGTLESPSNLPALGAGQSRGMEAGQHMELGAGQHRLNYFQGIRGLKYPSRPCPP